MFTQYAIDLKSGDRAWSVWRRYSEFEEIARKLRRHDCGKKLKLPGKKMFGNLNEAFIQHRMEGLAAFLRDALAVRACSSDSDLLVFLAYLQEDGVQSTYSAGTAWANSYVSKIPPWMYLLKAFLPQGDRVPIGTLRICIERAEDLPVMDMFSSDPYVSIKVGERCATEAKTKVVKKSLNPVWSEEFLMEVTNATGKVELKVWDWDLSTSDDLMGTITIPLEELSHQRPVSKWYRLDLEEEEDEEDEEGDAKAAGKAAAKDEKKGKKELDASPASKKDRKKSKKQKKQQQKKAKKAKHHKGDNARVKVSLRYSYSKLGELASHWNPEPTPPPPAPKFNVDVFYGAVMELMVLLGPLFDLLGAIGPVLSWEDPYTSGVVCAVVTASCLYPWSFPMILQCLLLRHTLQKYVLAKWRESHVEQEQLEAKKEQGRDRELQLVSAAEVVEEPNYSLGMVVRSSVNSTMKVIGMSEDMAGYQETVVFANDCLKTLYSLFDWSSPSTTQCVLVGQVCLLIYSLFLPLRFVVLFVALFALTMETTPVKFALWLVYGLVSYAGRKQVKAKGDRIEGNRWVKEAESKSWYMLSQKDLVKGPEVRRLDMAGGRGAEDAKESPKPPQLKKDD